MSTGTLRVTVHCKDIPAVQEILQSFRAKARSFDKMRRWLRFRGDESNGAHALALRAANATYRREKEMSRVGLVKGYKPL